MALISHPLLTPRIPIHPQVCLDPSKRITVDEALSSQWFSDQAASDALTVGGSDVRGLMKEWNARRAVLKLTNLRAKGAAHPKKEGDAAASSSGGTGPIGDQGPHAPRLGHRRRHRRRRRRR